MEGKVKMCIVKGCNNNSKKAPNKIYLSLPKNAERLKNWCFALKLNKLNSSGGSVICEDHFDLPEDATNWMFFKTIGEKICLKPEVVPHKCLDGPAKPSKQSQLTEEARQRKAENLERLGGRKNCDVEVEHSVRSDTTLSTSSIEDSICDSECQDKLLGEQDVETILMIVENESKPAPGFIQLVQQPHTVTTSNRLQNTFTVVSGVNNGKPMFSTVQTPGSSTSSGIKHEWFEKTVRAAARVNSNLSYTLTQLNRQQSQASTVESLATVHNKLQEVLSTSINTLIQIRKSLRTEFIAGIRNMKFPPAKPHSIPPSSGPIIVKDDDDVILVTPKTTVVSQSHPPPLVLNPAVIRKPQIIKTSPVKPKPSTSTTSNTVPMKGGFLKVRSLSALQTVPSECITIPDDPVVIIDEDSPITNDKNGDEHTICEKPLNDSKANKSNLDNPMEDPNPSLFYNVKEKPSSVVTKMMQVHVLLHRSQEIEERLKRDNFSNSKT